MSTTRAVDSGLSEKGLKVGAISVHGIAGIWGTLAVGMFDTTNGFL